MPTRATPPASTLLRLLSRASGRRYNVCGADVAQSTEAEFAMDKNTLLQEARQRLAALTEERLRVVNDFLAYLLEREESEATAELLAIPGFEEAFQQALREAEAGEVTAFSKLRRDV